MNYLFRNMLSRLITLVFRNFAVLQLCDVCACFRMYYTATNEKHFFSHEIHILMLHWINGDGANILQCECAATGWDKFIHSFSPKLHCKQSPTNLRFILNQPLNFIISERKSNQIDNNCNSLCDWRNILSTLMIWVIGHCTGVHGVLCTHQWYAFLLWIL